MVVSPLAVLVAASGGICLVAGELVRRRWTKPGATWFTIAAVACAVWALAYGGGMLVTGDVALRELFEVPIWLGHGIAPVAFFLFVAAYTGQLESIPRTTVLLLWVVPIVTVGLVVTNGAHGLLWTGYDIVPTAGAATTSYEKGPWLYVHKLYSYAILTAAAAILGEMIIDRDALYTAQAAALFVVVVPIGIASVAWVLGAGPYPLSLTPFLFGPVFAVASVVLFRSSLFDSPPAARRIGRKRLLDDFSDGILVIDDTGRIVEANDAAQVLFDEETVLDRSVEDVFSGAVDVRPGRQQVRLDTTAGKGPYEVTVSRVTDEAGNELGHSLVFQDISEETRRRQQLAVLNRVLRHNLRNDMTVIQGYARQLADETEGHHAEMADTAAKQAGDLIELGEKARSIEQVLDELPVEPVDLRTVIEDVCSSYPDATITVDVPPETTVETQPDTLRAVLDAIVENAVVHTDDPTIDVSATVEEDRITIAVADDGPGIPDHELTPIHAGTETELEHGSGLGLWLIAWGTDRLGGEVQFDTPESGGTTVVLDLPIEAGTETE